MLLEKALELRCGPDWATFQKIMASIKFIYGQALLCTKALDAELKNNLQWEPSFSMLTYLEVYTMGRPGFFLASKIKTPRVCTQR